MSEWTRKMDLGFERAMYVLAFAGCVVVQWGVVLAPADSYANVERAAWAVALLSLMVVMSQTRRGDANG